MNSIPLVLWGAGGHAKVLMEFLEPSGYRLVALFDNNPDVTTPFPNVPLYNGLDGFARWLRERADGSCCFVIAIGGARGRDRVRLHGHLEGNGLIPIAAVHPSAFVARNASLGPGSQILAGSCVCAEVHLGRSCIVNTKATVDHESILGDGVHVAPGANLCGCVQVGDDTLIGAGSVILPRVKIGANSIVGAGSVVTKDVPANVVVLGNPARVVRANL